MFYLRDTINGYFKEKKMDILEIKDQEDGSAIVEANFTEEEINFFVEYAVNDILRKQLEKIKTNGG